MAKHIECKPCTFCGKKAVLTVSDAEWEAMHSGKPIQEALPHWSAGQRELLLTGMHQECWDIVFPKCTKCDELVEGDDDGVKDPITGRWTHIHCPVEEPL